MEFEVEVDDGDRIAFECDDTLASRWVASSILKGETYPKVGFLRDVRVVLDVGANCGAASVHFARSHPEAVVHAFEPGQRPRAILERNVAAYPSVRVHPFGLFDRDRHDVALYAGEEDSINGSILRREVNTDEWEPVELRAGAAWAEANGIDRIDVLKVDVEGCEVEVLEGLAPLLPTVQLLYLEYDSEVARRRIDRMLEGTHELFFARMLLHGQGEEIYIASSLVAEDLEAVRQALRDMWRAGAAAGGA